MATKLKYEFSNDYSGHREDILGLHKRNYGVVSERFYDSFYLGNPNGEPGLGLCFDGQRLVGQENYIRQDITYGGNRYKGALGINTIVDPDYRLLHGVFKNLVLLTMSRLREEVDLLCAFANDESKAYYLKYFKWEVSSKVQVYKKGIGIKGVSPETLLALLRPGKMSKNFNLREVKEFDPETLSPILDEHKKIAEYAYFYKDANFINWKYLRNKHYRLTGYLVEYKELIRGYVITYDDGIELKIVDFLIGNDDAKMFGKVLDALSYIGSRKGKKRLVIYGTPNCWYSKTLRKYFFIKRWEFDFITANLNKTPLGNQWVIQIGDFDIF